MPPRTWPPPTPPVIRAATIIEFRNEDGSTTRMLYEFDPRKGISVDTEAEYQHLWDDIRYLESYHYSTKLTISGTMLRGTVWEEEMPENMQTPTREIEQIKPQLEG